MYIQTFQEITSNLNYDPQFLLYKEASEQEQLNFESNKCEKYNEPFTTEELHRAIKASKNNFPGPDEVRNMTIKAIPETVRLMC